MTPRLRVELLSDPIEKVLWTSHRLSQEGVSQLTPLGVLYLLASSEIGPEVGTLTGQDISSLTVQALNELRQRYPGNGPIAATSDTNSLVEKIVEVAGGPNHSTAGHVLIAMLAPEFRHTDAYQFLTGLDVKEDQIRERMRNSPSGSTLLDQLTTDYAKEVKDADAPLLEFESLGSMATRVLAHLKMMSLRNVVIAGFPGVGRHNLLALVMKKVASGDIKAFQGFGFRKLNWNAIEGQPRPQDALADLVRGLEKTILVIDELTPQRLAMCQPLFKTNTPVVTIATSAEEKQFTSELIGKALTIRVDEPSKEVVAQILQLHLQRIGIHHNLDASNRQLDEQTIQMLMRYGPSTTGISLPGGAIHLLDLAASRDSITGDSRFTAEDVALIIQETTGISTGSLTQGEAARFANVPKILNKRIIGQDAAKQAIQSALERAQTGLRDPKQPIAVLAFLGPTGVGKTAMAKALAEGLFDDEDLVVRIDLSEYQEQHTTSRLVGAPPGYVGYDEGGQLTEAVRRRPFSLVLFDEFDKAHPDVLNILLQMMDDGRLTDGHGRTVDFRNTIIIFTSNHGSSMIAEGLEAGVNFEQITSDTIDWFRSQVRPEFFNRIGKVIVFGPITPEAAWLILDLVLNRIIQEPTQARYKISVEFTQNAKALLHRLGYSAEYGARALERVIDDYVGGPLAKILLGDLTGTNRITVDHVGTEQQLTFNRS